MGDACRRRLCVHRPVFDSADLEFIGAGRVAVPTHFFKVILALGPGSKKMYAAIVPNADHLQQHVNEFAVTVEEVERRTGFDFFSALEDSKNAIWNPSGSTSPGSNR